LAKRSKVGDLRTRIIVKDYIPDENSGETQAGYDEDGFPISVRDDDGFQDKNYFNVFGDGQYYRCKWVNAFGNEVLEALKAQVKELATLTMRYSPKITPTCLIYRDEDPHPYEVISVNNVQDRRAWLEVKVRRGVMSQ